jgi:hypothetical protein
VTSLRRFWRGDVPLGEAFWLWGILGGGVVNLFTTLLAAMLLTFEAPAWIAAAMFTAPIPANIALLVGVWRSSARPNVGADGRLLARTAMAVWTALMCLV